MSGKSKIFFFLKKGLTLLSLISLFFLIFPSFAVEISEFEQYDIEKYDSSYFYPIEGEISGQAAPGVTEVIVNGKKLTVDENRNFRTKVSLKQDEKYLIIETRYKGLNFIRKYLVIRHPKAEKKAFTVYIPEQEFKKIIEPPATATTRTTTTTRRTATTRPTKKAAQPVTTTTLPKKEVAPKPLPTKEETLPEIAALQPEEKGRLAELFGWLTKRMETKEISPEKAREIITRETKLAVQEEVPAIIQKEAQKLIAQKTQEIVTREIKKLIDKQIPARELQQLIQQEVSRAIDSDSLRLEAQIGAQKMVDKIIDRETILKVTQKAASENFRTLIDKKDLRAEVLQIIRLQAQAFIEKEARQIIREEADIFINREAARIVKDETQKLVEKEAEKKRVVMEPKKWLGFEFVIELEPGKQLVTKRLDGKYYAMIYLPDKNLWIPLKDMTHQEFKDLLEKGTIPTSYLIENKI